MLDAKKVRLSLALLPGREVLLVGGSRETLDSGIYRHPKEHKEQNKSQEHMVQCAIK